MLIVVSVVATVTILAFQSCRHIINRVDTDRKVVSLTFDDGPNPPLTGELLRILDENEVRATFFLIGSEVAAHVEVAREISLAGHEIGNHSYDWTTLVFKSKSSIMQTIKKTEEAFAHSGITHALLFRPPKGILSPKAVSVLQERGYTIIGGDVVAGDWNSLDFIQIKDSVLKRVKSGSIIVLHDGGGDRSETIKAVPLIINELRRQGYSFLMVGDLLKQTKLEASSTLNRE